MARRNDEVLSGVPVTWRVPRRFDDWLWLLMLAFFWFVAVTVSLLALQLLCDVAQFVLLLLGWIHVPL